MSRQTWAFRWWPLTALGDDYLFDVVSVDLLQARLNTARDREEVLRQVQALPKLRELTLHRSQTGDDAISAVARLKRLEWLGMLDASCVTDDGIAPLGQLDKLTELWLGAAQVTDEWLEVIGRLRSVENLTFSTKYAVSGASEDSGRSSRVTCRGLRHLRRLTRLKRLDLSYKMAVTDEWLPYISTLKLEQLNLRHTQVTSASLKHLKDIQTLSYIDLSESARRGRRRHVARLD